MNTETPISPETPVILVSPEPVAEVTPDEPVTIDPYAMLAEIHKEIESAHTGDVARKASDGDVVAMAHLALLSREDQEAEETTRKERKALAKAVRV